MFNPEVWSRPQWTALILMALRFGSTAVLHGKPKSKEIEKWNGFAALFAFSLWTFLLIFGGFYA